MAAITAAQVNDLRARTGLGMMECKKALAENDGDLQKAIDWLRTHGIAKMDARTQRASAEGRLAIAIVPDRSKGAIVQVNCETDFVAKNEKFLKAVTDIAQEALAQPAGEVAKTDSMQARIDDLRLTTKENIQFNRGKVVGGTAPGNTAPGNTAIGGYVHFTGKIGVLVELETGGATVTPELLADLGMHVTAASPSPLGVSEADIPADLVAKEKEIAKAQAIESGKPEAIAQKIVTGKVRKYYEEVCLNLQFFIKDDKKRVQEILPKGVKIKSFVRFQV